MRKRRIFASHTQTNTNKQQLQTATNKTHKHNNKQTQAKRKQSAVKNLRKTQDAHKLKSLQSVVAIGSLFEAFLSVLTCISVKHIHGIGDTVRE